ncbi:putative apoptosis-inducing factor 2 [Rosellinia necatrix]|uniref:Putative apoptosis-inducing factor 2 n=1 Tax=Rosellinia necatrix TaxID=77044 RepID=A0A1S7UV33_ROSNE|nr:putative apoptosis-inducing factor 2 [Rosellinia necatrix]
MLEKTWLVARAVGNIGAFIGYLISRSIWLRMRRIRHRLFSSPEHADHRQRNIVVVGASMAGYHAAKTIAEALLPGLPYQVVVVEPHDHFHFTWVLPRFSVVEGHEHKAFIPYGPYLRKLPDGVLKWIQGCAIRITKDKVHLKSGEEIPYEFLVVATGAGAADALPSRVDADDKTEGIAKLRGLQTKIKDAKNLVVVGGGAAGVELATDAKSLYSEKTVVLVHSRDNVMHRFGAELQKAAMDGLKNLGINVITGDRLIGEDRGRGVVKLRSGREVKCDFLVNCAGQKPNSALIAELSPGSITSTGHILVKPTMQIDDDLLPNVYVCGDVAETHTPNPNSRTARGQATVAADNVILAIDGKQPANKYSPQWLEGLIKLTLGLDKSVTHVGDFSGTELLFPSKEKDVALMAGGAWRHMGATPFQEDAVALQRFVTQP